MEEDVVQQRYKKYLKIQVDVLEKMFPINPPLSTMVIDPFAGSDHEGDVCNFRYGKRHMTKEALSNWVLCSHSSGQQDRFDWYVGLVKT